VEKGVEESSLTAGQIYALSRRDRAGLLPRIDPEFLKQISLPFAQKHCLIAFREANDKCTHIWTDNPENFYALDSIGFALDRPFTVGKLKAALIQDLLDKAYERRKNSAAEVVQDLDIADDNGASLQAMAREVENLLDDRSDAPIIQLLNTALLDAVRRRASDLHLQPTRENLVLRYRVDGILHDVLSLPKRIQESLITRVKVMGNLDIAERRVPQDGAATVRIGEREVDLRIASQPTLFGERIVMRLQDKSTGIFDLAKIGLEARDESTLRNLLSQSHGILLVTGPTGSGKTTTLYAGLSALNSSEMNILTIEDPIEYYLPGISQTEINEKKGLTFAKSLRAMLRQDPDIIMVGEIRDTETARIAVQASLTGHLVLSTLHTNDAPTALTRLLDLGIEPYLAASSIMGVVAQRLVRTICPECRTAYAPSEEERLLLKDGGEAIPTQVHKGTGCELCLSTGYLGRTGIYEMMCLTDSIKEAITKAASASVLRKLALEAGMHTLRQDAFQKLLRGLTTVSERERVSGVL